MTISDSDFRELRQAHDLLENPGLAAKMISTLGRPIELALDRLPSGWQRKVHAITQKSIEKALDVAIGSFRMHKLPGRGRSRDRLHTAFTARYSRWAVLLRPHLRILRARPATMPSASVSPRRSRSWPRSSPSGERCARARRFSSASPRR